MLLLAGYNDGSGESYLTYSIGRYTLAKGLTKFAILLSDWIQGRLLVLFPLLVGKCILQLFDCLVRYSRPLHQASVPIVAQGSKVDCPKLLRPFAFVACELHPALLQYRFLELGQLALSSRMSQIPNDPFCSGIPGLLLLLAVPQWGSVLLLLV